MIHVYLVGGAVRDRLLGLPVRERDWVVVGATPKDMLAQGYRQVGKDFPVFLHPKSGEEYALARTERKSGKGYTAFSCYAAPDVTLEDDLLRRDLTINAMAEDEEGNIVDPYDGQADLKAGILRHVSPAFVEDPLRVLRLARFAAKFASHGFVIAEETQKLLREIVRSGELNCLVPERVWKEFQRVLGAQDPQVFLQVLRLCGALAVLFPSLDRLYGVPNPPEWHPEIDSGVHTEMVLQQAALFSTDAKVCFAALVHDLGKGATPPEEWPRHHKHGARGVALIKAFCEQYPVPKEYKELAVLVSRYHIDLHKIAECKPKTILAMLEGLDAFRRPQHLTDFLQVCEADVHGRTGLETCAYPQKDTLRQAFDAAKEVAVQDIIAAGFSGEKIKNELHRRRVAAIKVLLNS